MRALLPLTALLLSTAILLTGSGLLSLLLPVRAQLEGFGGLSIALIASSYFAGFGAGCALGARLVRRVGHIRTFGAMASLVATLALLHAFLVVPALWWVLRACSGFCFAVLYMIIESWLNERSTRETRGAVLSAYMVINLTVVTLGQLLLPLQDPRGMGLFALVAIASSLATVPVALAAGNAPAPIEQSRLRLRRLYAVSPAGVGACAAVGLANGAFWALGPSFALGAGLGDAGVALFMSAAVIGGALGQWPFGRLSDRTDRRNVIVLVALVAAAAGLALSLVPDPSPALLYLLAGLWGAAAFPVYSLGVANANDHAAPGEFVETSGGLLLVYALGAVVGPMVASAVTATFGGAALFLHCAAVHAGLTAFVLWRRSHSAPVPIDEHVDFRESLVAAVSVSPSLDAAAEPGTES